MTENTKLPRRIMLKRKILPYALALALLPLLAFAPQEKLTPQQLEAASGLATQISSVRYTRASGEEQVVLAKTLTKIQMIQSADGNSSWLELFFHNGDYVYVKTDSVTLYAGTTGVQTTKVLLTRVTKDNISFPKLIP